MEPNINLRDGKKIGPIISVLVIVIIIVVAALYFFSQKLNTGNEAPLTDGTTSTTENVDDVETINSDLDAQLLDVDYSF